jgi:hypothetical protein
MTTSVDVKHGGGGPFTVVEIVNTRIPGMVKQLSVRGVEMMSTKLIANSTRWVTIASTTTSVTKSANLNSNSQSGLVKTIRVGMEEKLNSTVSIVVINSKRNLQRLMMRDFAHVNVVNAPTTLR